MTAKGSSKDCCCGGCAGAPLEGTPAQEGSLTGSAILFGTECCACLPNQICLSVYKNTVNAGTFLLPLTHTCGTKQLDDLNEYIGQILVNGALVNVDIYFHIDLVHGQCQFIFSSYDLGITSATPGAVLTVDDNFRSVFCPRCKKCDEQQAYPIPISFFITIGGASFEFRITGATNSNLTKEARCCGCIDPCATAYPSSFGVADGFGSAPLCAGCGCICSLACITIYHNQQFTREIVPFCNGVYQTGVSGIAVELVPGYGSNGCCYLRIHTGSIQVGTGPSMLADVKIGEFTLNPCPDPVAEWEWQDASLPPLQSETRVYFECASCGSACDTITTPCCPVPIPNLLYLTLQGTSICLCAAITVPCFWDPSQLKWIGSLAGVWCSPPAAGNDVNVSILCQQSSGKLQLTFNAGPCTQQIVTGTGTCSPLDITFSIPAQGLSCCGNGWVGPGTITGTLTS